MNIFSIEKNGLKRTDWKAIENYQSYNMPILYLTGSVEGISKDDKVTLNYIYQDRAGTCTLKWQGSSSVNLPKKNYTIKFDNAFEVVSGWGVQSKYCLKANYVDSSHSRNIVCAKLWGQIVKSRATANTALNALPNGGAIDGFPIIISLNGEFHGLYTWNIPKDPWLFGMDDTGQQAIVCAELNTNGAVSFNGTAVLDPDLDFELEYSSDEQSAWVAESLNRLIIAVKDSDGTNITYGIAPYLDFDSAIDYYCHAVLTGNYDGLHRNYLLATYDGVKWFFTGYDMDVVLGLRAMGRYFYPANHTNMSFTSMAIEHKLWGLIWKYMRPQLRERYTELRNSVMSVENVANTFVDFTADIVLPVYVDDGRKWNTIPSSGANNLAQIITYYDLRCRNADEWIKSTVGQTTLPTQVDPSSFAITNSLSNCVTNNTATTVKKNSAYTATITVNEGYELSSVVVKMGGVNITSTAYSNGVINISSVTANIEITASAIAVSVPKYINQVPISKDTDGVTIFGEDYNGDGVKDGYLVKTRLSSSGSTKECNYASVTGYISASSGAKIRIKGTGFDKDNDYICAYKSDLSLIGATSGSGGYTGLGTVTREGNGVTLLTLPSNSNIKWVRVCSMWDGDDPNYPLDNATLALNGPGAYLIVTVGQEIVD